MRSKSRRRSELPVVTGAVTRAQVEGPLRLPVGKLLVRWRRLLVERWNLWMEAGEMGTEAEDGRKVQHHLAGDSRDRPTVPLHVTCKKKLKLGFLYARICKVM